MGIRSFFKNIHSFVIDILFPIECLGCRKYGEWLCQDCLMKIGFNAVQTCPECKKENAWGRYCDECKPGRSLDGILSAGTYKDKLLNELIKQLKYRFTREIGPILGKFLVLFLRDLTNKKNIADKGISEKPVWRGFESLDDSPRFFNRSETVLIPVPLHKRRLRWRGYNQSDELARIIAEKTGYRMRTDIIKRTGYNKPQALLPHARRKKNIADCFSFYGSKFDKTSVILIDDVATTGSTLEECAKILKQNGVQEVWGLVAANR